MWKVGEEAPLQDLSRGRLLKRAGLSPAIKRLDLFWPKPTTEKKGADTARRTSTPPAEGIGRALTFLLKELTRQTNARLIWIFTREIPILLSAAERRRRWCIPAFYLLIVRVCYRFLGCHDSWCSKISCFCRAIEEFAVGGVCHCWIARWRLKRCSCWVSPY